MANAPAYHARTHKRGGTDPLQGMWEWGDWIQPDLENGWEDTGGTFCAFSYRNLLDEDDVVQLQEWRGHVNGGTSGTVVCTLPEADRLSCDSLKDVLVESGTGYQMGRVYFDMSTGEVTIYEDLT